MKPGKNANQRIVHVLDTGALYLLHNKHKPKLEDELRQSKSRDDLVLMPTVVLLEAEQKRALDSRKLAAIRQIVDLEPSLDERIARLSASCLRAVASARTKCARCSDLGRPNLVDAVVMAIAGDYVTGGNEAIVYTSDIDDMEILRGSCFGSVKVEKI